jgi:hypothetical protein
MRGEGSWGALGKSVTLHGSQMAAIRALRHQSKRIKAEADPVCNATHDTSP